MLHLCRDQLNVNVSKRSGPTMLSRIGQIGLRDPSLPPNVESEYRAVRQKATQNNQSCGDCRLLSYLWHTFPIAQHSRKAASQVPQWKDIKHIPGIHITPKQTKDARRPMPIHPSTPPVVGPHTAACLCSWGLETCQSSPRMSEARLVVNEDPVEPLLAGLIHRKKFGRQRLCKSWGKVASLHISRRASFSLATVSRLFLLSAMLRFMGTPCCKTLAKQFGESPVCKSAAQMPIMPGTPQRVPPAVQTNSMCLSWAHEALLPFRF